MANEILPLEHPHMVHHRISLGICNTDPFLQAFGERQMEGCAGEFLPVVVGGEILLMVRNGLFSPLCKNTLHWNH